MHIFTYAINLRRDTSLEIHSISLTQNTGYLMHVFTYPSAPPFVRSLVVRFNAEFFAKKGRPEITGEGRVEMSRDETSPEANIKATSRIFRYLE